MTVRLWSRNQVRVGGRYPVGGGLIEIDSIEELPFAAIDDLDVRRAGEADRETCDSAQLTADPSPKTPSCGA